MKDTSPAFAYDLTGLNRGDWLARVEDIADDFGHAEPVGPDYNALFIDAGRTLLVCFESVARIRKGNDDAAPLGWGFVDSHGWSSLTIMAPLEVDWFRHEAVYGYIDRLIDDGFFDDFDRVLFYGAGPAGYAAAAFSVAAPDARVLAVQPQATLDPARSRWDRRYPQARRLDFASRYGYAPDMVVTASDAYIIHDPSVSEDAMHACLFSGDNTAHFSAPYIGPDADRAFVTMDILPDLLELAMDGALTRGAFAELWRARQRHMPYLRTLLYRLEATGEHDALTARLCRAVLRQGNRPLFAKRLAELEPEATTEPADANEAPGLPRS